MTPKRRNAGGLADALAEDTELQHRLEIVAQRHLNSELQAEMVEYRGEVSQYAAIKQEVAEYREEAATYASEQNTFATLVNDFSSLRASFEGDMAIREHRNRTIDARFEAEHKLYLHAAEDLRILQAHIAMERATYVATEDELHSLDAVFRMKKSELGEWWQKESLEEEKWMEGTKHRHAQYSEWEDEKKAQWEDEKKHWHAPREEKQHWYARHEWEPKHWGTRDEAREEKWSDERSSPSSSRCFVVARPQDLVVRRRPEDLATFDHEPTATVVQVDGECWRKSINGEWWPRNTDSRGKASQERQEAKLAKNFGGDHHP